MSDDAKPAPVGVQESGFTLDRKTTDVLDFPVERLGQRCPRENPPRDSALDVLGDALTIREVAALIGCSVWTVRQRCMKQGLPHFRPGKTGRLIFYRNQVVRWLIEKQQQERRW